jgi:hypothetical protein
MALSGCAPGVGSRNGITFWKDQSELSPSGSVELRTSPLLSTATQAILSRQEIPVMRTEPPPLRSLQAEAPAVGFVEERKLPPKLPAAHSALPAQETPRISPGPPGSPMSRHPFKPAVGLAEAIMRPFSPTATQSSGVPQETPRRSRLSSICVTDHASGPPVGSVEVRTFPEV